MNLLSIDLEMAQPSGKIIQIGAVAGNTDDGTIFDTFSCFVNPNEQLSEYIIKLTGITQVDVDEGYDLITAYKLLIDFSKKYECRTQPVVWGSGDSRVLKEQLLRLDNEIFNKIPWIMGFREYDVKTLFQSYCMANNMKTQSGLRKACNRMEVLFEGPAHNALQDSINTWKLFIKMLKKFSI